MQYYQTEEYTAESSPSVLDVYDVNAALPSYDSAVNRFINNAPVDRLQDENDSEDELDWDDLDSVQFHETAHRTTALSSMPVPMYINSFDDFLGEGCPPDVYLDFEFARALSICDIADWFDVPTLVAPKYDWSGPLPKRERSSYLSIPRLRRRSTTMQELRSLVEARTQPDLNIATIPPAVPVQLLQASLLWSRNKWDGYFKNRRTILWRLVVAQSVDLDPSAFALAIPDGFSSYTLTPKHPSRWYIPLQQIHTSPFAISDELADVPHTKLISGNIVTNLNTILSTQRKLEPDLESWIEQGIKHKWDLGTFYGYARPWWRLPGDFITISTRIDSEKLAWKKRYASQSSTFVIDPVKFPPRRVWDLYSNRVLPSHVIFTDDDSGPIPSRVWAVSHAWLPEDQRHSVFTGVNGYEWPVSIPHDTSLDHIRIELLNMGAEYAFLDLLCLRQPGDPACEELREMEWEIDIPMKRALQFLRAQVER